MSNSKQRHSVSAHYYGEPRVRYSLIYFSLANQDSELPMTSNYFLSKYQQRISANKPYAASVLHVGHQLHFFAAAAVLYDFPFGTNSNYLPIYIY